MPEPAVDTELVLRALLFATLSAMPVSERISILGKAGWTNQQIGDAVGLTANAVKLRRRAVKARDE